MNYTTISPDDGFDTLINITYIIIIILIICSSIIGIAGVIYVYKKRNSDENYDIHDTILENKNYYYTPHENL